MLVLKRIGILSRMGRRLIMVPNNFWRAFQWDRRPCHNLLPYLVLFHFLKRFQSRIVVTVWWPATELLKGPRTDDDVGACFSTNISFCSVITGTRGERIEVQSFFLLIYLKVLWLPYFFSIFRSCVSEDRETEAHQLWKILLVLNFPQPRQGMLSQPQTHPLTPGFFSSISISFPPISLFSLETKAVDHGSLEFDFITPSLKVECFTLQATVHYSKISKHTFLIQKCNSWCRLSIGTSSLRSLKLPELIFVTFWLALRLIHDQV